MGDKSTDRLVAAAISLARPLRGHAIAQKAKSAAARAAATNLDALAAIFDCDKGPRDHGYTTQYARHLQSRRRDVRSMLEIGVGGYDHPRHGSGSLLMWRAYFPNAQIYGLDIAEKHLQRRDRITILRGDQGDGDYLRELAGRYGPFDLVIDDGSHIGRHQHASFDALFPTLLPGALYVIEDLDTSYWDAWEGGAPGTPGTGVDLVKSLVDSVHLGPHPVGSLCVYPELALIERAATARQLPPSIPWPD